MAPERLEILSCPGTQSLIGIPAGTVITSHNHFLLLALPHMINIHAPSPSSATHRGNLNNPFSLWPISLFVAFTAQGGPRRSIKDSSGSPAQIHISHSLHEDPQLDQELKDLSLKESAQALVQFTHSFFTKVHDTGKVE